MDIFYEGNAVRIVGEPHFHPRDIFDNGQSFRFADAGNGVYEGVAHGRFLRVSGSGGDVTLYPATREEFERIWHDYFDLGRDYSGLFADCGDEALRKGRAYAPGLRVLRQEPFEMLISAILSANNNIKRIRSIVEKLCARYGRPVPFGGKTHYAFPEPGRLAAADPAAVLACGCGYRAPYILETARGVAEGFDLNALFDMPYGEARRELLTLPGVGPKVADCVLLFAYAKTEAFPADVWIRRVLEEVYGFKGNDKQTRAFVKERFGDCAGIAQQYLFYYARENKVGRPSAR